MLLFVVLVSFEEVLKVELLVELEVWFEKFEGLLEFDVLEVFEIFEVLLVLLELLELDELFVWPQVGIEVDEQ